MNNTTPDPESKNVIGTSEFKSKDDWLNTVLDKHCVSITGAVEAVAAVEHKAKDDGTVITEGVKAIRGNKGKRTVDVVKLCAIADANSITYKEYVNVGMYRMNIGNMLRAAARKRGGLFLPNTKGDMKWVKADEGFEVNDPLTEKKDGTKIVVKKVEAEAATPA